MSIGFMSLSLRSYRTRLPTSLVQSCGERSRHALRRGDLLECLRSDPRFNAFGKTSNLHSASTRISFRSFTSRPNPDKVNYRSPQKTLAPEEEELHESPYTIPNALTVARIIACPFLGYNIIHGNLEWATAILVFGGVSDGLDGWIARKWNVKSVLGSILDPAADKALMTTLVGTLAWSGMLPLPLAILIFGRDLGLSISAFYFRFISLPRPRTLRRYFDPSIPSAEVKPTQISKVNTALQLVLMGTTLVNPLLPIPLDQALTLLQWTVAGTTVWSGFSYLGKSGVKILARPTREAPK